MKPGERVADPISAAVGARDAARHAMVQAVLDWDDDWITEAELRDAVAHYRRCGVKLYMALASVDSDTIDISVDDAAADVPP